MDRLGNVYVTGLNRDSEGSEWVTMKYSSAGLPVWTNLFSREPAMRSEGPLGMVVDNSGNAYLTGDGTFLSNSVDFVTLAYDTSGLPLWTNYYGGPSNSYDAATAIALHTDGNIFVTGASHTPGQPRQCALVSYSGAGVALWTNRCGEDGFHYYPKAICVNSDGLVIITGNARVITNYYSTEVFTSAFLHDGFPLWTNRYRGSQNDSDVAGIVAAPDGGVVVAVTGAHVAVIKYSRDGAALWTNLYPSLSGARGLAAAPDGTAYLAGYTRRGAGGTGFLSLAYSTEGVPLWTNAFSYSSFGGDTATAIVVDAVGNVLLAGVSSGGAYGGSATIAYSKAGLPLWTNFWQDGIPSALVAAEAGTLIVMASFSTIKYQLSVPLQIQPTEHAAILTWTNSAFGWTNLQFQLQSTPQIDQPFTNIPGATSPFTNPIAGDQGFFRIGPVP